MKYIGGFWKQRIADTINQIKIEQNNNSSDIHSNDTIKDDQIVLNKTPDLNMGDLAFPMFSYSRIFKMSPNILSRLVADKLSINAEVRNAGKNTRIEAEGPYVNVFVDRAHATQYIVEQCISEATEYGKSNLLSPQRVMIEYSAPNTNKPLHLGHLRNDALGESVSRILVYMGAELCKVNLVNDRGIHICKSMLAYQKFGNGEIPQSRAIKADHFVGEYYVKYTTWEKKWKENINDSDETSNPLVLAQEMLRKWEAGDPETLALWKQMNGWALEGIQQTYRDTGIVFDKIYYESQTYLLGKSNVLEGLNKGVFYKDEEGTIWLSLEEMGLDKKVLLRADGTSVYITQDLGTAQHRFEEWPFDKMIYVVAHEQNYHFKVLFFALSKLGFQPAVENKMFHLGYGMVHLPEGRMKSREGTVVDADTLIESITKLVQQEILQRETDTPSSSDSDMEQVKSVAREIALGAIHYYLLSINPKNDVTFNPKSSIQFHGNTGPYLQYTCARITSMFEKFELPQVDPSWEDACSDEEWMLVLHIDQFGTVLQQAAEKYDPSLIANYLFDLASAFSSFYQNTPIATASAAPLQLVRMKLTMAVLQVLKNGMYLLNVPYITKM